MCLEVVITNRDYACFLRDAIDSALGQEPAPRRVLVVDDGSTDGSRDVLAGYGDRIDTLWRDGEGQAAAINAAFACVDADLVVFLDADDRLRPGAVARILSAAAATPECTRVQYRMRVIDDAGTPTGEVRPAPHLALPSGDLRPHTLTSPFDAPWSAMSGNAFARETLERLLPVPEDGEVGADWYLVHVSNLLGPVAAVQETLADYRLHESNRYGRETDGFDLPQLRHTIGLADATRRHIARRAVDLGLAAPSPASMSDIGNRLISFRADPAGHPLADSRGSLLRAAARATARRPDAGPALRAAFLAWAAATALAPARVVPSLARGFTNPRRPAAFNALLSLVRRRRR